LLTASNSKFHLDPHGECGVQSDPQVSDLAKGRVSLRSRGAVLGLGVFIFSLMASAALAEEKKSASSPKADAGSSKVVVRSLDKAEVTKLPCGWIRWLINSKIDPKAEMTFGVVKIEANSQNPLHVHHKCAEYLYMLSGSCRHRVGKQWVTLKAGDAVRIPAGVPHTAKTLDEPMQAVIVYDCGKRDFTVVNETAKTGRE